MLVELMQVFIGKRQLFELMEVVEKHQTVYIAQLMKMGWNAMTATTSLKLLVSNGILSCTVEGGLGENVKKVYRLTPKGLKILEHLREIQKLLNGRLGNK